jgi:hypothetical protein
MNMNTLTEKEMALALGLAKSRENVRISQPVRAVVVMSAKPPTGAAVPFTHVVATVSRLQAVIEAKKAVRAAGMEPWFLIDVVVA